MRIISLAILAFFSVIFFGVSTSFAERESAVCKEGSKLWGVYHDKICQCVDARKPGGAGARSISDFVCPVGIADEQSIAYQIALDDAFRKIDKKVMVDLKQLQKTITKNAIGLNLIIKNLFDSTSAGAKYPKEYGAWCQLSNPKNAFVAVMPDFGNNVSSNLAEYASIKCSALVERKLTAFKRMAYLIALGSIQKWYVEDKHDYFSSIRDRYESFLMKWDQYIAGLAKIKDKWSNTTKNVQ